MHVVGEVILIVQRSFPYGDPFGITCMLSTCVYKCCLCVCVCVCLPVFDTCSCMDSMVLVTLYRRKEFCMLYNSTSKFAALSNYYLECHHTFAQPTTGVWIN